MCRQTDAGNRRPRKKHALCGDVFPSSNLRMPALKDPPPPKKKKTNQTKLITKGGCDLAIPCPSEHLKIAPPPTQKKRKPAQKASRSSWDDVAVLP
jgi:hypothetical protein